MKEWIVFKQIPSHSPCADLWDSQFVNISAENNVEACKLTALERGEGRYIAFPNEFATYFDITIKKIAEVNVGQGQSMV